MTSLKYFINGLTLSRIGLIAVLFLIRDPNYLFYISLWAGATDFLDGYLARRFKVTSKSGERLDQVADKLFHLGAFFYLGSTQTIHMAFVLLFTLREIFVVVARYFNWLESHSNNLGKIKSFLSYVFIVTAAGAINISFQNNDVFNFVIVISEIVIIGFSYWSMVISFRFPRSSEK